MKLNPVLDVHIHSIASGHAYSTIGECARAAADKCLQIMAITDHAPGMEGTATWGHFGNLRALPREMCGVTLLRGVELNIIDYNGKIDMSPGQCGWLEVRIASLHVPCIQAGTVDENTRAVIGAMQNPLVQIIGHLGDPGYSIDIDKVLDAAQETGTFIEINNISLDPNIPTRKGGEATVRELALGCLKRGVPVIMGSDSHVHTSVGELSCAQAMLEELVFPKELVLNTSAELFCEKMGLDLASLS